MCVAGGLTDRDAELMQFGRNVADRVKTGHARELIAAGQQGANIIVTGAEPKRQVGSHPAAHGGVEHIRHKARSIRQDGLDVIILLQEVDDRRAPQLHVGVLQQPQILL
jgi:hypothetical protein